MKVQCNESSRTPLIPVCLKCFLANFIDTHTPQTKSAPKLPSTRETIDLVSDDESGVLVKKREPSSSPVKKQSATDVPNSVTVRKRSKQTNTQGDTPSMKKQRSPSGVAVSIPNGPSLTSSGSESGKQATSTMLPVLANNPYFTQIPDSEGEDNDDFFAGEDFNFDSDIVTPDIKKHQHNSPNRFPIHQAATTSKKDDNIVPESPFRIETVPQTNYQSTKEVVRPPLAVNPSSASVVEASSIRSLSTPNAGDMVYHLLPFADV